MENIKMSFFKENNELKYQFSSYLLVDFKKAS